jgi:hypothetical protein
MMKKFHKFSNALNVPTLQYFTCFSKLAENETAIDLQLHYEIQRNQR